MTACWPDSAEPSDASAMRHDLVGVLGDLAVRARELLHRRGGLADRRGLLGGAGRLLLGGREDLVRGLLRGGARTPASAG